MVEVGRWFGTELTSGKEPPLPVSVFIWVPPLGALATVGGTSFSEEQPASINPTVSAAAPIPRDDNETSMKSAPSLLDTEAARDTLVLRPSFNDLVPNPERALL